jgi:ribosomal protein S18 acetylase RimI-like enzyme
MAFILQQATLEHADRLGEIFDAYRQFYGQNSNVERARTFLAKRIIGRESVIFFATSDDDAQSILGFTQLYPSFSSVSMRRIWILNDLFVSEAARGQGVASALMQRAREFAQETAAKGLSLETALDNTTAQRLYEKLGWTRNSEFAMYYLHF